MIGIIYTNSGNPDFIMLCQRLDDNLNGVIGAEKQADYNQYNLLHDIHDVWIAYEDNTPVGCAAFKQYENNVAEVKRVFVMPKYRGRSTARAMMKALEEKALEKKYEKLILETGKHLKEAISLYQKFGYTIIENYGQYKDFPDSICMQKELYSI
jgi:GNAT superfamily N-acetyltransferase